jgi:hypothetical protein
MTRAEHLGVSGLSAADVTQRWLSQYGWSLLIAVSKVWRYVNTAPMSPSTACKKCMWNKTEKGNWTSFVRRVGRGLIVPSNSYRSR